MSDTTFEGFVPPTKNFFHMPNEWINICAKINNLAELKVVQYVLRHTWGYREYDGKPKPITVDEFMHGRKYADGTRIDEGTGLSKPSVIQGLKYAIKNGYLTCETDDTDKARVIKSYALKMSSALGVKILDPQIRGKDPLPRGSRSFTTEVNNLDIKGKDPLQRSEKDTIERNSGKKERTPSIPESDSLSHSSTHSSFSTQDDTQSHIATVATRNTSSSCLSDEEQRIQGYWCQLGFTERPSAHEHWRTLSKHIVSFEDMDSLFKYTQAAIKDKPNKRVFPGNLVDHLDGWKQDRAPKPEKPKTSKPYGRDLVAEHKKMVEQYGKPSVSAGK